MGLIQLLDLRTPAPVLMSMLAACVNYMFQCFKILYAAVYITVGSTVRVS